MDRDGERKIELDRERERQKNYNEFFSRFHWVSFFTSTRVIAGTELTWDYNYQVNNLHHPSIFRPDKEKSISIYLDVYLFTYMSLTILYIAGLSLDYN